MRNLKYSGIRSPETEFTNKESLKRLNAGFGLTLSPDEVFRKAMDLLKYPHKNPEFFVKPETEAKAKRIRRRRRRITYKRPIEITSMHEINRNPNFRSQEVNAFSHPIFSTFTLCAGYSIGELASLNLVKSQ
jgi:hypothetical protein